MSLADTSRGKNPLPGRQSFFSRFQRDSRGATALEFAIVGLPFLMLLFGIITLGLFYFTTMSFENAVEQAGRLIRTGQVDQTNMTEAEFKAEICNKLPQYVDCQNKVKVFVQSFDDTANAIAPMSCLTPGGTDLNTATSYDIGEENKVVLVVACYEWELPKYMPWIDLGNMGSTGKRLIQAATTFRNEPYDETN